MSKVLKVRKKPIAVEAIKYVHDSPTLAAMATFMGGSVLSRVSAEGMCQIVIQTLEGDMIAEQGDYIIKGIKGELYPCKPDIFEASYDILEEE